MHDHRPHRLVALPLFLLVAGLVWAGCSTSEGAAGDGANGGAAVVASTSIWADVTSRVACGEIEVPALIPVGTDAHAFEPSVQDADTLRGADLVVTNGLGLEEGLHDALHTAEEDGVTVLEVGPDLSPLDAAHDEEGHDEEEHDAEAHEEESHEGHDHGDIDPHVWMDPDRVATAVPLIADALASVDGLPVSASEIEDCAAQYVEELTALSAEMDQTLAVVPAAGRKLVTNHEALGYFADRFDFEVVGAVVPSTSSLGESNPRELDELAAAMRAADVSAVFAETTGPTELADALAEQVGSQVRVVQLYTESLGGPDSDATTYVDMMRADAGLVADALAPGTAGTNAPGQ
jgi:zinc/manganese transport system substrate-binding protein